MGRDQNRRPHNTPWADYPDDEDMMEDDLAFGWAGYNGADVAQFMGGGAYRVSTVEVLEERDDFTPDFYKFRDKEEVPLFVFDHMKVGGARNKVLLKNANYYGTAHTVQKNFRVYKPGKRRLEILPFIVGEDKNGIHASIRGELWGVSPEHIVDIDEYYRNTMAVERVTKLIVCEEQAPCRPSGSWKIRNCAVEKAFMYVARPKYWSAGVAGDLEACVRVTYTGDTVPAVAKDKQFYDIGVYDSSRFGH